MNTPTNQHLEEDRVLRAVIDAHDLTQTEQDHLSGCEHCRHRVARLTGDVHHVGHRAAQYAPEPQRRIRLPEEKTVYRTRKWQFGLVPAAVAVCALLLAFWWTAPEKTFVDGTGWTISSLEEESISGAEMQVLSDSALPDVFLDIIGDESTQFSDEFIDFVVPDPDSNDDSISGQRKELYHA